MKHIFFLFLFLASGILFAQTKDVDLQKLDAYFEKTAKEWGIRLTSPTSFQNRGFII